MEKTLCRRANEIDKVVEQFTRDGWSIIPDSIRISDSHPNKDPHVVVVVLKPGTDIALPDAFEQDEFEHKRMVRIGEIMRALHERCYALGGHKHKWMCQDVTQSELVEIYRLAVRDVDDRYLEKVVSFNTDKVGTTGGNDLLNDLSCKVADEIRDLEMEEVEPEVIELQFRKNLDDIATIIDAVRMRLSKGLFGKPKTIPDEISSAEIARIYLLASGRTLR